MFKTAHRFPHLGIVASITGFLTSILSLVNVLSVVFGLAGAIFGCLAGYYTWRVQRLKYKNLLKQ